MPRSFALVALAGLVASLAVAAQPAGQPPTPPPPAAQPPAPPAPQPIAVPDGPVVAKQELGGGLLVEDMVLGSGYEVKPGAAVVALYHGTLKTDGSVFDSSFERGEPAVFPLNGVIAGWTQGLPGMKVGGVRKLTIPAALAYGERSPSEKIPANSDLVFVIQLVDTLYVEDVKPGTGEAASGACVAVTTHIAKDSEGKEVEKSDASAPYVWLPGEMHNPSTDFDAMQLALDGMKVGGSRKVHVPAQMNIAPPQLDVKRPRGIAIDLEFDLIGVRNLPQQQQRRGR